MARLETLEDDILVCSISYALNQDVNGRCAVIVDCFQQLGLTEQCSLLWAHNTATNAVVCADECLPGAGGIILNGSPCLTSVTQFDQVEIIGSSRDRSKHFPDTGLGGSGSDYPWFRQL